MFEQATARRLGPRSVIASAAALSRYSIALVGPVGSAGAQFLLSLVLLRIMDQAAFGRFSVLLIASQFSWGVWTALFCAPLPILLTTGDVASRERLVRCLVASNLVGAVFAFAGFFAIGLALGERWQGAALFAGYAAVALLRWFARAHAYATGLPLRTTASDTIYAVILLAGIIAFAKLHQGAFEVASAVLLVSALAGMPAFGRAHLRRQFLSVSLRDVRGYRAIWRQHSGWSLLGVLTTEATANAHAYLVTLIRGPTAFAPIAASALMIRPITVAMNALTEFERARMARQIGDRHLDLALASARFFRLVLIVVWLATGIATIVLLHYAPHLIFPPRYNLSFLVTGATLWMLVGLARLMRTPESALLQAGGAFRPLAMASVWSAGVSIVAVLALLFGFGALMSINGILIGEGVFAIFVWRQASVWLATRRDTAAAPPIVFPTSSEDDPVLAPLSEPIPCRS